MIATENKISKESEGLLWLVAMAVFMETLDSTIINTALPAMALDLNESPIRMYGVAMSYSLTLAMLIPASGWIAERFGIRRIFMRAIMIFCLGSLCCALSQTFTQLIASRVLQGIGGSMLLPLGRLAVLRSFPRDKYLAAISFVAVPGLVGPLIGPTLGGFLVSVASWHWIFLINIPIGLLGLYVTPKYMPVFERLTFARFDYVGFILLTLFMVATSLALEGLSGFGLPVSAVVVLAALGLAALVSYVLHATNRKTPLFSLDLFRSRTYSIGLAANLFARIGTGGIPFLIPMLLQIGFGMSALDSGLTMTPIAIAAILSKRMVTRVIVAFGYRKFLLSNTLAVGFMIMSFALISESQPLWIRILQFAVFGMVNSLQFSAMNSLTLKDLAARDASSGNSLYSMVQMLSLSFGVACAGSLLSIFSEKYGVLQLGSHNLFSIRATFLVVGVVTCVSGLLFLQLSQEARTKVVKPVMDVDT
jgi:EmrB/QacA subfamily drug resistance transporter